MNKIEIAVIKSIQAVLDEKNMNKTVDMNFVCSRENGIDSLGIVTVVLNIEEELDCELDSVLAEIRKSKTIAEIVKAVEREIDK